MSFSRSIQSRILNHWNGLLHSKPWIISTNPQELWRGVLQNNKGWLEANSRFLGLQVNLSKHLLVDKLRMEKGIADPTSILRILAYMANGLSVQPLVEHLRWIRIGNFPGLKARTCVLSNWDEEVAVVKRQITYRKIDFSSIFSLPVVSSAWTIEEVFRHPRTFWNQALELIDSSVQHGIVGDMTWECPITSHVVLQVVFQKPDPDDSFPGSTTTFFSGESVFFLPVEIAQSLPTLVVGRCLQAAESLIESL